MCNGVLSIFAYNSSNSKYYYVRSCITFFPPRRTVQTEFRVWNSQLIRYAGHKQRDGSVVGDPVDVEFTEVGINIRRLIVVCLSKNDKNKNRNVLFSQ